MDEHLKQLADVGLALTEAEEAIDQLAFGSAAEALDRADKGLADLRAQWPEMSATERTVVGRTAAPLRARLDATRKRLPQHSALSLGSPERDPDEDVDPAADTAAA